MNPQTQRIAIGTGIHTAGWLVSTPAGQTILKDCPGTERRPRCLCRPGGVEMYVGRRGQVYYLSRMPGTGFLHADGCASVEDNTLLSGAHAYAAGAIIERADGMLQLAINLDRRERPAAPQTQLSIDGLLDLLIEQADLNRVQIGAEPRTVGALTEVWGEVLRAAGAAGRPCGRHPRDLAGLQRPGPATFRRDGRGPPPHDHANRPAVRERL